ncbi:MAG: PQQ-binding-like beta-propeller repeat protein [Verrucomicrobia bacterium]|nr:PQQ-binding-like beta-propeller repeat protein [Verrucomicrobiota bacterium]
MKSPVRSAVRAFLLLAFAVCALFHSRNLFADDWPQWLGPQRDGVWRETGILEKFPEAGPKVRWRKPVGKGYAGPAVVKGRVYVCDRVTEGAPRRNDNFNRAQLPGTERVLCLDEATGEILWKHEYDCPYDLAYPSGPRTTPVVSGGKVYTLGAEGNLFCLDADKGTVFWSHEFKKDFNARTPTWGFSANPLLDGQKLICIVGGPGSVAVAFDKDTGKELWRALSAREPGYSPPMIYEAGGKRQLIIWHPEALNSLDPETGSLYWSEPFAVRSGLCIPTPRKFGDYLFITAFYNGPMLLKLAKDKPAAEVVWRGNSQSERNTDKLHGLMCTPFIEDGHIFGVCSYGQLRCLKLESGERLWETLKATGATGVNNGANDRWCNAFLVKNGDRFFIPNERGDLIIAKLSPQGYEEISRAHLVEATNPSPPRGVVWSHPAFANKNIYFRNDVEIACFSLAK